MDDIGGDESARPEHSKPAALVPGAIGAGFGDAVPAGDRAASSSSSSERGDDLAGDENANAYVPPTHISGKSVSIESHRDGHDVGLRVRCSRHPNCRKFSSLGRDPHGFGPICAHLWLGAWLALPCANSAAAHSACVPTKAQMQAFRATLD